ncbi:hypothetical protein COV15_01545 [Candidatus Woesearchaeota archaeon CG10_big_fil_rev_8_21_14_0_10_34_12]|nr:MAG: hypothetical protein COV15_01545 [Candidatus Woesearchaeota archaeon CG10_big_fil_rev_8_21_14_0_10_34_12]
MPKFYKPISAGNSYDRDSFVSARDNLGDLEDYVKKLTEDADNPDAMEDLGKLLYGDTNISTSPVDLRIAGNSALSEGYDNLAKYVEKNFATFMNKLDEDDLQSLVFSLPLYLTGSEDHNRLVSMIKEIRKLGEIAENASKGDSKGLTNYVMEKLKKAPDWLKSSVGRFIESEKTISNLFGAYFREVQVEFNKAVHTEEGKVRKELLCGLIKDSLARAKHEMDIEPNGKDKGDIYDGNIKIQYLAIANVVYPKEKGAKKVDENPDREARKAARKKIGMR